MRVFLKETLLEFEIKTYLHAHFQNETITFTDESSSGCDFVFDLSENRAGLMYYMDGEIHYEAWLGKEHPLFIKRNESKDPLKIDKMIVKDLIYQVAGSVVGRKLPWGILTGVRPTKLVYKLIKEHGKKRDLIAEILHKDYRIAKDKVSLILDIVGFDGELLSQLEKDSVSLYIGIPFCPSKCAYCSFTSYSIEYYQESVYDYLEALEKEMAFVSAHMVKDRPITSFYIGGGTPTALNTQQLDLLLRKVKTYFNLDQVTEFTVEAGRPDTIDLAKLKLLKSYGVNRISINPQTMNQETLDLIGRNHTIESFIETYNLARTVGFDVINVDLIMGLPSESRIHALYTLEQMWQFKPDNVTVHTLSLKKGSSLKTHYEEYRMAQTEEIEEMVRMSRIQLELMGLKPYYMYRQKNTLGNFENVGYAKEGKHSIYNIVMIEEAQSVIAMGAGAVSKLLYIEEDQTKIARVENVKEVESYIERIDEMIARKAEIKTFS